jgi:hypothetical protein
MAVEIKLNVKQTIPNLSKIAYLSTSGLFTFQIPSKAVKTIWIVNTPNI